MIPSCQLAQHSGIKLESAADNRHITTPPAVEYVPGEAPVLNFCDLDVPSSFGGSAAVFAARACPGDLLTLLGWQEATPRVVLS
jgi:hypothetical protein